MTHPNFSNYLTSLLNNYWSDSMTSLPESTTDSTKSALSSQVGGNHYKGLKIQPIEYIYANDLSYCEANIVKYATRHAMKNGREDVEKIIHYAQLLLEMEYPHADQ